MAVSVRVMDLENKKSAKLENGGKVQKFTGKDARCTIETMDGLC